MSIISEIHKDLEQGAVRLITEHRDRLMAEAMRLCGDMGAAEDLVSCTLLKAINNISSYKSDDNFFGWLKTIMGNIHKSNLRHPVARGTAPVDPDVLAADESLSTNETDERILKDSDHDALREAVERLPSIYRNAVVLHYFEEFSIKEIAAIIKAPVGTVFWRLNVARKMLAKDLAVKLGKKKPLAVLFAVLLGVGTLFGAWQVVETIFTAPAPTPTTTPTPTPTPTSTPTAADSTAPVMTYPTFSSETTTSTEPVSTKQEKSTMTTIKKTLFAAFSAVSLASTANAVDVTPFIPDGVTYVNPEPGIYKYEYDGDKIVIFADPGSYNFEVPEGASAINYLVVGGGGSGGGSGNGARGGGGAGGLLQGTISDPTLPATFAITVGSGGVAEKYHPGKSGGNSSLSGAGLSVTANGGGGGSEFNGPTGGGSGGGGSGKANYTGGKGTDGQGNNGGDGIAGKSCGAGGGGAGGPGAAAGDGQGGIGLALAITGKEVWYAAGGAGQSSVYEDGYYGSAAGSASGRDGTGGGGGGASGTGGSGIVVIRCVMPAISSEVTVAYSGKGSGTVSGAGKKYDEGSAVTLEATAEAGSHFVGWSWEASLPDANADGETLTFTMIAEPVEITAKFEEDITEGVTVEFEGGMYGEPDPAYGTYAGYADGTERTYSMAKTVIGEGGEKIYLAGWKLLDGEGNLVRNSDTGLRDGESSSLVKFTCGTDEAFTLVWIWETRYTLTAVANPAEGGTITGAGDYAAGATVTLTVSEAGGSKLTGWTDAPEAATSVENTLIFAMPDAPTTVTANFEMVPWGITVVSGTTTNDNRNLCVQGADYQFQSPLYYIVQEGELRKRCIGYTLTPMREDGMEGELIEVVPEGETLTATVTYEEPVKLTWQWADDYYFTLTKDGEGGVAGPAEGWYPSGTPFKITATPANNYEFLCWMGSVFGAEATISGTITKPTNVKALFSPVQQVKSVWEAVEQGSVVLPAESRTVKSLGKTYCVVKIMGSTEYKLPKKVTSIDCLVVGGGGSGGASRGGGGGAGGFLYQTGLAVTPGETLRVTVGAGGEVGNQYDVGKVGKATTLEITGQTITAHGGGGGGRENVMPKNGDGNGASGGGVGGNNSAPPYPEIKGGASTAVAPEQGNPGGDRTDTAKQRCGAGGGGAGSAGENVAKGKGGDGLPSTITGEKVWYAAGGAGGGSGYSPGEGAANTGNGGGGSSSSYGNAGGSGVVIIRYALPSAGVVFMIY